MRRYLCGRAHGHARFTTRPRRRALHWREGPAKRVRVRTAMYPASSGKRTSRRDPDSVDVSQGLELLFAALESCGRWFATCTPAPQTPGRSRAMSVEGQTRVTQSRFPLYPQQQTFLSLAVTSDKCQSATLHTNPNVGISRRPRRSAPLGARRRDRECPFRPP